MGTFALVRGLRRWWWLIILATLVTVGAAWLSLRLRAPVYQTRVEAELGSLLAEDLATLREVLEREQVRERTLEQLGLQGEEARYKVVAKPSGMTRVVATFSGRTPSLVAEIANSHVALAIDEYTDLRVGQLRAQRQRLESQVTETEAAMSTAEEAMAAFEARHDLAWLDTRFERYERQIVELEVKRAALQAEATAGGPDPLAEAERLIAERQAVLEQLASVAPEYNVLVEEIKNARQNYQTLASPAAEDRLRAAVDRLAVLQVQYGFTDLDEDRKEWQKYQRQLLVNRDKILTDRAAQGEDPLGLVDLQLTELHGELDRLTALAPTYYVLAQQVSDVRKEVTQVRSAYTSAKLKEEEAVIASIVKIVKQAEAPSQPALDPVLLLAIALAAGLCLGVVLAFTLEYASTPSTTRGREAHVQQVAPAIQGTDTVGDPATR
jgi:uncharacterized protein involved in exopolysaccharide biosynthesis